MQYAILAHIPFPFIHSAFSSSTLNYVLYQLPNPTWLVHTQRVWATIWQVEFCSHLNNLTLQNRFQIPENPYEIRWRDANPADRLFPVRFPSPHHILHVQSAGSHWTTTVLHLQGIILALMQCMQSCKCKLLQSISRSRSSGEKKVQFLSWRKRTDFPKFIVECGVEGEGVQCTTYRDQEQELLYSALLSS